MNGDERARGAVASAVRDELREALRQADVRGDVTTGGSTGAVVVRLSLGEAALLAQALTSATDG
ncbi:hypothetical protein [Streptomyces iconiensis]|uniref:Uncharacterized protein n=1 Tax=Streptomyces iconiensis TaxID=1384038 RepID=A0ABT6ZUU4_9ACTN|nr:hypothetical protein [Streptomyces iconiensis]MDJ1132844.1 hypothetical protein [Streptomyces iconiensis]